MDSNASRRPAALITGAASGIGMATAVALAGAGERVVILDRNAAQAHAVAQRIRDAGGEAVALMCDLAEYESVEAARQAIEAQGIDVELLISNAFVATGGGVDDFDLDTWQKGINVNLLGTVRLLKAFLPSMMARARGHVVLTSSGLAMLPKPTAAQMLPYIAAKSGLIGLAQALVLSLPKAGIDVSLFCPALTATPGHRTGLGLSEALIGTIDAAMVAASRPSDAAEQLLDGIRRKAFLISTVPNHLEELISLAGNGLDPRTEARNASSVISSRTDNAPAREI